MTRREQLRRQWRLYRALVSEHRGRITAKDHLMAWRWAGDFGRGLDLAAAIEEADRELEALLIAADSVVFEAEVLADIASLPELVA